MKLLPLFALFAASAAGSADVRVFQFAGLPAQIVDLKAYVTVNGAGNVTAINVQAQIAQVYSEPSGDTALNELGFVTFDLGKEAGNQITDQLTETIEGIVRAKWAQQNPSMPLRERRNDRRSRP